MARRNLRVRDERGRFRSKFSWEKGVFWEVDTLFRGLAQFRFKMEDGILERLEQVAVELVDYMKSNAPWEDQTGQARAGLTAEVFATDNDLGLLLYDVEDYEVWLEIRWGGRYAIIIPTMDQKGNAVLQSIQRLMSEIVFYD